MSKGIVLIAFGHPDYGKMAFNLALSIKNFNDNIQIQLLHDDLALSHLQDYHKQFFNLFTKIKHSDIFVNGKLTPERVKTRYYDYLAYKHNIYLDVDAVCLKDIAPLLDYCETQPSDFLTMIHSWHNIGMGEGEIKDMGWAKASHIWEHFGLEQDAEMPATQSSFAYIRKGEQCASLFKVMQNNLDNPLPLEKLLYKWGGGQPDELYLNVSLAQIGYKQEPGFEPIYFSNVHPKKTEQIVNDHYLLGIYGAMKMTHGSLLELYDRLLHSYCRGKYRINHQFKAHTFMKNKFANRR